MWVALNYTYAIEHSDKIKDSVDANLDPRPTRLLSYSGHVKQAIT
jgi:hypothetical protein